MMEVRTDGALGGSALSLHHALQTRSMLALQPVYTVAVN